MKTALSLLLYSGPEERVEERTAQLEAANQQLQESYNLLPTLIDFNPNPIFVKDCQGRYLFMNSPGADLFNKSVEEIIGQDDTVLYQGELVEILNRNFSHLAASGGEEFSVNLLFTVESS